MKSMTGAFVLLAAAAAVQVLQAQGPASFTAPFAFRTPSGSMPAGNYQVEVRSSGSSSSIVMLRHAATNQANLFVVSTLRSEGGAPNIGFQCINGDDCRLERVTMRGGAFITTARPRSNEKRYSIILDKAVKPTGE